MWLEAIRGFLPASCPLGRFTQNALATLLLVSPNRRRDSVDVEVVRLADVLSDPVQLVNDWIAPFRSELPAGNSSGVQMTGGSSPSERQIASIVPRIVALAMCLQFHVNRYSI